MSWWMWLIIIIFAMGAWQKLKADNTTKAAPDSPAKPKGDPKPKAAPHPLTEGVHHWPEDQGTVPVYGTRYYQAALKELAGEHGNKRADVQVTAHLIPDPKNEHDDKAIRVDVNGKTVGHLSRDDARSFRRRLGAKKIGPITTTCNARVWGGFDRNNEPHDYGVDLFIKPFGT